MSLATLVPLALSLSIALVVLALGLRADFHDAFYLVLRPGLLFRSLLAMYVVMPAVAAGLVAALPLDPAVEVALVALALSPVPPVLPAKQEKAGGEPSYVLGLLLAATIGTVFVVPSGIFLLGHFFEPTHAVPLDAVAPVVVITVILPLMLGMVVRRSDPAFAARMAPRIAPAATVLLVAALTPLLFAHFDTIVRVVGNGTLLVLAVFTGTGLLVGHVLGGPDPGHRTALALATGTRHPGVALAIASATFPNVTAVAAVVLWHLVIAAAVTLPYTKRRRRIHGARHPRMHFPPERPARGLP